MASDFYQKTAALYEEFQKREIHYLNLEKNLSKNVFSQKNLPLQEYLSNILQREKETEENYKIIMKHMEQLDRQTDLMSLQLEKLVILTNNTATINLSSTSDNLNERNFSQVSSSLEPIIRYNTIPKTLTQCTATQTENTIICQQCKYPLSTFVKPLDLTYLKQVTLSNNNDEKSIDISMLKLDNRIHSTELDSIKLDSDLLLKNKLLSSNEININQSLSTYDSTSMDTSMPLKNGMEINPQKKIEENLGPHLQNENKTTTSNASLDDNSKDNLNEILNHKIISSQPITDSKTSLLTKAEITNISKEVKTNKNNEFHEDNASHVNKKSPKHAVNSNNDASSDKQKMDNQQMNSSISKPKNTKCIDTKTERESLKNNNINIPDPFEDRKSESSINISDHSPPHHSEKSATDSEDSLYDKPSSLTATAAYQALLGNVNLSNKVPENRVLSDSESDEIENAIATVTRKSSTVSLDEKTKTESKQEKVSSNISLMKTKVVGQNKPKSKLSKSTKKVLGIDTSSGSEIESEIKSQSKKIEEDEFDFYD